MHHCKPKIQSVLVWSKDENLTKKVIDYLKLEFEESLFPFTVEEIPTVTKKAKTDELHLEIENYDFSVIKLHEDFFELILVNNERHKVEEIEDFEEILDNFARKIIDWRNKNLH